MSQFTALDYKLEDMSVQQIRNAIFICSSNKGLAERNLNALFEEDYKRAGMSNPKWNVKGFGY